MFGPRDMPDRPSFDFLISSRRDSRTRTAFSPLSSPLPPDRRSRLAAGLFLKLNTQHPENKNMSRWFGHALATCSAAQILASGDSQPSKARKAVLLASAGQYLTAPLTMLSQKEFKPEMVALNTVTCGVVGALCLKAALKE